MARNDDNGVALTAHELMSILRPTSGGVTIPCWIQPRASADKVVAILDGALKIALKAPPVDGKANAALEKFLADRLGLSRSSVQLTAGESSRRKTVAVKALTTEQIAEALSR